MIYRLDYELDQYFCIDLDQDDMEEKMGDLYYPEGKPLSGVWVEIEGEMFDGKGLSRNLSIPEIASWEGTPVLSERAYRALKSDLAGSGEFLPIKIDGQSWYIFNTLTITDAVDPQHSEQDLRGGIYVGLKSLKFIEEKLDDQILFKTNFDERVGIYCTHVLKEKIEANNLTGLKLREDLHRP